MENSRADDWVDDWVDRFEYEWVNGLVGYMDGGEMSGWVYE